MKKYEKVVLAVFGNIVLTVILFMLGYRFFPRNTLELQLHSAMILALLNAITLMIIRDEEYYWTCFTMVLMIHHLYVSMLIVFLFMLAGQDGLLSVIPDIFGLAFQYVYMIDVPVILALFGLAWLVIKRTQKRKPTDS